MKSIKAVLLSTFLLFIFFGVLSVDPVKVAAATASDLQAQIQALLAQLTALQSQMTGGGSAPILSPDSEGPRCVVLNYNLRFGDTDAIRAGEVTKLQTFLVGQYGLNRADYVTGYFGRGTQGLVSRFQTENGLLATGWADERTLSFMASKCAPTVPPTIPTSSGLSLSLDDTSTTLRTNSDSTNADDRGIFKIKFEVTATNDDVFVDKTAQRGAGKIAGIVYSVRDMNGNEVETMGSASASLSATANVDGTRFKIEEGETETFTLTVTYDPDLSGFYSVRLGAVNFNVTNAAPNQSVAALPVSDFETDLLSVQDESTSKLSSATINQSSLTTNSPTPTISGTVKNTNRIRITIGDAAGKVYDSGNIPVMVASCTAGAVCPSGWTTTITKLLGPGRYTVYVYDGNKYPALLTQGTLVIGTGPVVGITSCTITADKASYKLGDTIKVSWTSQNATYAGFVKDASGKDNILVPGDKLSANGTQALTASVLGNPTVTLMVGNPVGAPARCSVVIPVTSTIPTPGALPDLVIKEVTTEGAVGAGQDMKLKIAYVDLNHAVPTGTTVIFVVNTGGVSVVGGGKFTGASYETAYVTIPGDKVMAGTNMWDVIVNRGAQITESNASNNTFKFIRALPPGPTSAAPTGTVSANDCTVTTPGQTCAVKVDFTSSNSFLAPGIYSETINVVESATGKFYGGSAIQGVSQYTKTDGPNGTVTFNLKKGTYIIALYGWKNNAYVLLDQKKITVAANYPAPLPRGSLSVTPCTIYIPMASCGVATNWISLDSLQGENTPYTVVNVVDLATNQFYGGSAVQGTSQYHQDGQANGSWTFNLKPGSYSIQLYGLKDGNFVLLDQKQVTISIGTRDGTETTPVSTPSTGGGVLFNQGGLQGAAVMTALTQVLQQISSLLKH